jgi:hypothetical protein
MASRLPLGNNCKSQSDLTVCVRLVLGRCCIFMIIFVIYRKKFVKKTVAP